MFKKLFGRNNKTDWSKKSQTEQYHALQLAVLSGMDELEKRINEGVDINCVEEYGNENILAYYVQNWKKSNISPEKTIKFFVSNGIDINHQGNKRTQMFSALHLGVMFKSIEIVKTLVESGAIVELQDKNGNTPLWKGVLEYRGDIKIKEIMEYLIKKGASLDTENYHGNSARKMIETIHGGIEAGHNDQSWTLNDLLENK